MYYHWVLICVCSKLCDTCVSAFYAISNCKSWGGVRYEWMCVCVCVFMGVCVKEAREIVDFICLCRLQLHNICSLFCFLCFCYLTRFFRPFCIFSFVFFKISIVVYHFVFKFWQTWNNYFVLRLPQIHSCWLYDVLYQNKKYDFFCDVYWVRLLFQITLLY